jgi:hypothetical protein
MRLGGVDLIIDHILTSGPTKQITSFFTSFGYVCPENFNPADFVMNLSQTESLATLNKIGLFEKNQESASEIRALLTDMPVAASNYSQIASGDNDSDHAVVVKASSWKQIMELCNRETRNIFRDVQGLVGRFGVTIVLNLLFGLIFLGVGGKSNADANNFAGHFGAIMMATIGSMFGPAQPVMLSFPSERPLFLREYSTGSCKLELLFASRWSVLGVNSILSVM